MASDIETTPGRRPRDDAGSATSGARYPRWYWPSFTLPGLVWLLLFFVLPFYVVLSVAFGTVDPLFRNPLPVYQPWWWSFDTFVTTAEKFYAGDRIYFDPLVRTLLYVGGRQPDLPRARVRHRVLHRAARRTLERR